MRLALCLKELPQSVRINGNSETRWVLKKLRDDGYFYTTYTPVFQHLGCELLVVWYLTLNRKTKTEERLALNFNALPFEEVLVLTEAIV